MLDPLSLKNKEFITEVLESLEIAQNTCISVKRNLLQQHKDKRRYDLRHKEMIYKPDDEVWVWIPIRKKGQADKLQKNYFGPYKVLRQLSEVTYEVCLFKDEKQNLW